jgi:hypothetical protein
MIKWNIDGLMGSDMGNCILLQVKQCKKNHNPNHFFSRESSLTSSNLEHFLKEYPF